MAGIPEEHEQELFAEPLDTDFAQLLNGFGEPGQDDFGFGAIADSAPAACPTHAPATCNCAGLMSEWDLPQPAADPLAGLEEPDYSRFENWIPKFIRPEKPCDYCQIRRLACYKTRGEAKCTACSTLFRECSLEIHDAFTSIPEYSLDTLHVVDEDAVKERGTVTGIKQLRSKGRGTSSSGSVRPDDEPSSSKRNGIRFPRHAVKTLREWMDAHTDNPYPTEEEKAELEQKTELKPSQIANWLANARRRRKVSDKARPRVCASPSLGPSTPAIDIPGIEAPKPWDELNPFERWRHSPPENEPANALDIADAMAHTTPLDDISTSPSTLGRKKNRSSTGSGFTNARAPSSTSLDTSSLSASNSAHFSNHSSQSHGSFGSFSSSLAGKRDRRRRKRAAPLPTRKPSDDKKRIFQCTFCTDTFKSKYDWTRHEKSLHLSLEKWICAPLGPVITDPATGEKRCVYCDHLDPTDGHLEGHNHSQCEEKGLDARTFYRKDHLRQHLRLMHGCQMTTFMENWKSVAVNINSRCGFCSQRFTVWQERVDHLTAHFKAGARMSAWKGCRGLDPAVAAQVTNAMPPYLIGLESKSPIPYSATNRSTWRASMGCDFGMSKQSQEDMETQHEVQQSHNGGGKATCWEILTVRLGKYANTMAQKGVTITDEMLQTEARKILYDSDDDWNQTAADNPEWLDLFKKAHGLDFIPSQIGGEGRFVPEDLETYGDLGLRIPFSAQLKAFNAEQAAAPNCTCPQIAGVHSMTQHTKLSQELRKIYRQLASEGVLHGLDEKCTHHECDNNIIDVSAIDNATTATSQPKKLRWCIYSLPQEKALRLSDMAAVQGFKQPMSTEQIAAEEQIRQRSANFHRSLEALIKMDERLEAISNKNSIQRVGGSTEEQKAEAHAPPLQLLPDPVTGKLNKKAFLQRHCYELPPDRAQLFATTTPAWRDAGSMPPPVSTTEAAKIFEQEGTTTGAMAEFLGSELTGHLPFVTDVATSDIPIPTSGGEDDLSSWAIPRTAEEEQQLLADFDRLIAETTSAPQSQAQQTTMTTTGMDGLDPLAATNAQMEMDLSGMSFDDMEMDFDGVFDMPMDETFVLPGTSGGR